MSFRDTMRGILRSEGLAPVGMNSLAWLSAWRALASMTSGVTREDPRFLAVMAALKQCDTTFLADDWPNFQRAALAVKRAVDGVIS